MIGTEKNEIKIINQIQMKLEDANAIVTKADIVIRKMPELI